MDAYWLSWPAFFHFQHYTTADTCMSAFKAPLDPSTALGGFSGNNYSEVRCSILAQEYDSVLTLWCHFSIQASAFVVTYPVNNAIDEAGNGKAVAWEKAFIRLVKVSGGLSTAFSFFLLIYRFCIPSVWDSHWCYSGNLFSFLLWLRSFYAISCYWTPMSYNLGALQMLSWKYNFPHGFKSMLLRIYIPCKHVIIGLNIVVLLDWGCRMRTG